MNWLRAPSAGDGFRFALSEKQVKEMELNSTSLASCAAVRRPAVSTLKLITVSRGCCP